MVLGMLFPFTNTRSNALHSFLASCDKYSYISSVIRSGISYFLVESLSADARLTCGDRYVASILKLDPTAPSIPQPMCRPNPISTLNMGIFSIIISSSFYSSISLFLLSFAIIFKKQIKAMSEIEFTVSDDANLIVLLSISSRISESGNFQMVRNESPVFLFGDPQNSSTVECTI